MADLLIVENRWDRTDGDKGLLRLHFTVPSIGRQGQVGMYRRRADGEPASERKMRQEMRACAREWAQYQINRVRVGSNAKAAAMMRGAPNGCR